MVEFLFAILLFAIILVFATLIIVMVRQVAVVALIIVAPIAFALAILPNTRSLFTKWRKTFLSLLLLWPVVGVIMGASFLAQGIFNSIANSEKDRVMQTFWQISALAATVIPLVAIPSVMKGSLKSLGKLGGVVSGFAAGRVSAGKKSAKGAFGRTAPARLGKNIATSYKNNREKRAVRRSANFANGKFLGNGFKEDGMIGKTGFGKKVNSGINAVNGVGGKVMSGVQKLPGTNRFGVNSALSALSKGGFVLDEKADTEAMATANAWVSDAMQNMGPEEVFSSLIIGKMADGHELSAHETRALAKKGLGMLSVHQKEAILAKYANSQDFGVRESMVDAAKASGYQIGGGAVDIYKNMSNMGPAAYDPQKIAAGALSGTKVLGEGNGDVKEYLESANSVGGSIQADGTWKQGPDFTGEGNTNYAEMIRNNSSEAIEKASKEGGSSKAMEAKRGIEEAKNGIILDHSSPNQKSQQPENNNKTSPIYANRMRMGDKSLTPNQIDEAALHLNPNSEADMDALRSAVNRSNGNKP